MFDLLDRIEPSQTFVQIARAWLECKAGDLRPDWHRECTRLLTRDLLPRLGSARSPSRRDITATLEPLPRGVRRNAHTVLSAVFGWAIETGRLGASPMIGLRRPPTRARERVLSLGEIRALWSATGDGSDHSRITRLLLLTGQRRDEIGDLRWTEIEGDRIVLPGSRTKNHRQHAVPLAPEAQDCLPRRRPGFAHLFGRRASSGFSGWSRCKERLDRRSGVSGWTLHDCRRSAVTHMAEMGLAPPWVIEALVNHQSGHKAGVAGTYNRATYAEEKRRLAER